MEGMFHRPESKSSLAHTTGARVPCKMLTPALFPSSPPRETIALRSSLVFLFVPYLFSVMPQEKDPLSEQPGTHVCDGSYVGKILDTSDGACEELRQERKLLWKRSTQPTAMLSGSGKGGGPVESAELWESQAVLVVKGKKTYKDITTRTAEADGIRECMNNQYLAEERMR